MVSSAEDAGGLGKALGPGVCGGAIVAELGAVWIFPMNHDCEKEHIIRRAARLTMATRTGTHPLSPPISLTACRTDVMHEYTQAREKDERMTNGCSV